MTTPRDEQPQAQPAPEPTVSTAPPRSRWHSIPSHVGPARTSTVILAVLWLALGALYLNVRPPTPATATTGGESSVVSPAPATRSPARSTTAPSSAGEVPSTSSEPPTTSYEQPSRQPPEGTGLGSGTPPPSAVLPSATTAAPTS